MFCAQGCKDGKCLGGTGKLIWRIRKDDSFKKGIDTTMDWVEKREAELEKLKGQGLSEEEIVAEMDAFRLRYVKEEKISFVDFLYVSESKQKNAGWGCFAAKTFQKGEYVGTYGGVKLWTSLLLESLYDGDKKRFELVDGEGPKFCQAFNVKDEDKLLDILEEDDKAEVKEYLMNVFSAGGQQELIAGHGMRHLPPDGSDCVAKDYDAGFNPMLFMNSADFGKPSSSLKKTDFSVAHNERGDMFITRQLNIGDELLILHRQTEWNNSKYQAVKVEKDSKPAAVKVEGRIVKETIETPVYGSGLKVVLAGNKRFYIIEIDGEHLEGKDVKLDYEMLQVNKERYSDGNDITANAELEFPGVKNLVMADSGLTDHFNKMDLLFDVEGAEKVIMLPKGPKVLETTVETLKNGFAKDVKGGDDDVWILAEKTSSMEFRDVLTMREVLLWCPDFSAAKKMEFVVKKQKDIDVGALAWLKVN